MMNKKGQITIFIIIAVIIIGAVILYFLLGNKLNSGISGQYTDNVYDYVEVCIEEGGEEAIYEISKNGGYNIQPEISTESGYPYYYINQTSYMPTKENIENELSSYVQGYIANCVRDFKTFSDLNIYKGNIEVKTDIQEDKVIYDVHYPLSIIKNNETSVLEDWEGISFDIRLGTVYVSILQFIKAQKSQEDLCLSCLMDAAESNDLYVEMQNYYNATIFTFRDENSLVQGEFLEFKFANEY